MLKRYNVNFFGRLEGKICIDSPAEPQREGNLLVRIRALEGLTTMDRVLVATRSYANFQKYSFGDELARSIRYINLELDEDVILDCGKVSSESTVELIFYDENGDETDKYPVGSLWLPVIDVLNYNINDSGNPQQHTSTNVDSWFAITPAGRVNLIIDYGKTAWNSEH